MTDAAWRGRLRALKREALTVWCVARHPRLPWAVRGLALGVAAYAFSPIDLIPDVIPVLGLLDDLLLVPMGVWAVLKLAQQVPALVRFRELVVSSPAFWAARTPPIRVTWLPLLLLASQLVARLVPSQLRLPCSLVACSAVPRLSALP